MRLAHLSDVHLDEFKDFIETSELLGWLVEDIRLFQPDAVLICGDSSPVSVRPTTPKERVTLAEFYRRVAEYATVVVISGNHDCAEFDVDIFNGLRSVYPIHVSRRPEYFRVPVMSDGTFAKIATLPYPSKSYLLSLLKTESKEKLDQACRDALAGILRGIKYEFSQHQGINILMGHLNVTGCDVGGFPLVGQDVEVGRQALEDTGAHFVALGHIHRHQMLTPRVAYSGSPRRVDRGEEGETKGYLQVVVTRESDPWVTFRETPVRKMATIDVRIDEAGVYHVATAGLIVDGMIVDGSDIRVRVEVDEERRGSLSDEEIMKNALMAFPNKETFLTHRPEYNVIPKQRVRSVAIQKATTDEDRLRAYLETLDPPPDAATVERLIEKLNRLDVEPVAARA